MKQTIFIYKKGDIETTHKIDFIYEPLSISSIQIKDVGKFELVWVEDEFTDNPQAHIRRIKLRESGV